MTEGEDNDDAPSYSELLEIARSMCIEEASSELHYCCRVGDASAVKALIEVFGGSNNFVNCTVGDNTPIHLAAANGHSDVTQILIDSGAILTTNKSGNTPLHWAAANGHEECVRILLSSSSNILNTTIDVLQKNQFGRSALTEGFSSQNTNVVQLLLEHDSASEEKLLGGTSKAQNSQNKEECSGIDNAAEPSLEQLQGVLHEFQFLSTPNSVTATETNKDTLFIRELPIANADNPFGSNDDAADDTTGYAIWCASLIMARWMSSMTHRFQEKVVCELGAGCGVVGLVVAKYSQARKVFLTDLNATTLENLNYNITANNLDSSEDRVIVQKMDWSDESTWPDNKVNFVLGSDLIYDKHVTHKLKHVVLGLLGREGGTFFYTCKSTERDGLVEFISDIQQQSNITLISQEEICAPHVFTTNPLENRDDEECFLHFHELTTTAYMLYEFSISKEDK